MSFVAEIMQYKVIRESNRSRSSLGAIHLYLERQHSASNYVGLFGEQS